MVNSILIILIIITIVVVVVRVVVVIIIIVITSIIIVIIIFVFVVVVVVIIIIIIIIVVIVIVVVIISIIVTVVVIILIIFIIIISHHHHHHHYHLRRRRLRWPVGWSTPARRLTEIYPLRANPTRQGHCPVSLLRINCVWVAVMATRVFPGNTVACTVSRPSGLEARRPADRLQLIALHVSINVHTTVATMSQCLTSPNVIPSSVGILTFCALLVSFLFVFSVPNSVANVCSMMQASHSCVYQPLSFLFGVVIGYVLVFLLHLKGRFTNVIFGCVKLSTTRCVI